MKPDGGLFLVVLVIWLALAILYATLPMFAMPGYATVWGWGSLIFLALAVLIALAVRGRAKHPKA